ncbi:MAG: serine hydrolase [Phycisphaerales bacterium]|nr:MAG: serine hydrolase [Phycisphaerales bacterium]
MRSTRITEGLSSVLCGCLCAAAVLALHASSPARTAEYSYQVPPALSDGWEVSSLDAVGIDTEKIEALTRRMITEQRFVNVRSMLIVRNGKLVHEAYSPYHQRNTLHSLASITKTVTSTLIGIAIDKGLIEGVDASVVDLLPDFATAVEDPRVRQITLKHLMTMSSGLEWFEHGSSYNDPRNSEHLMVDSENWMEYVLSRPVANPPESQVLYNTGGIHLLSAVIKSSTGLYANEFAEEHLFHPMGIRAYQWNRDPMGYPCTGGTDGGVGLRTRDLAKFGWLFLHDGTWKGEQIISREWIETATRRHVTLPRGRIGYGYNWFPGSRMIGGTSYDYIASFGYGGQNLYLFHELDLILVFTCDLSDRNSNVRLLIEETLEAINP